MKVLFADMSIYQAIFLRGLVTAPLLALLAWRAGVLMARLGRRCTWTLASAAACCIILSASTSTRFSSWRASACARAVIAWACSRACWSRTV